MDIEIEDTIRIDVSTLIDIDYVTDFSGRKTSEGDGRTAADIEHEMHTAAGEFRPSTCWTCEQEDRV